jgi:hypothetical protein
MTTILGFVLGTILGICIEKQVRNKGTQTMREKYESKYGPIRKSTQK